MEVVSPNFSRRRNTVKKIYEKFKFKFKTVEQAILQTLNQTFKFNIIVNLLV